MGANHSDFAWFLCCLIELASFLALVVSARCVLSCTIGMQVKAVSIEEDEIGGADTDEKTNASWILQNI